jgi:hypothetical protein
MAAAGDALVMTVPLPVAAPVGAGSGNGSGSSGGMAAADKWLLRGVVLLCARD